MKYNIVSQSSPMPSKDGFSAYLGEKYFLLPGDEKFTLALWYDSDPCDTVYIAKNQNQTEWVEVAVPDFEAFLVELAAGEHPELIKTIKG